MPESNLARADITRSIIGAFYNVYNRLGFGFVESNYAVALATELRSRGHHVAREYATRVFDEGNEIGFHRLDMVVDLKVVVELKSTAILVPFARRQLYNYLRATNLEVGLLLHFGPKPRFYRLLVPNRRALLQIPKKQNAGIGSELKHSDDPECGHAPRLSDV